MDSGDIMILIIVGMVFALMFGARIYIDNNFNEYYEYITMDNKEGIAKDCNSIRSSVHCELEDGTIIMVKQYKYIIERK